MSVGSSTGYGVPVYETSVLGSVEVVLGMAYHVAHTQHQYQPAHSTVRSISTSQRIAPYTVLVPASA
eukprot:1992686-Rhodomonas_salina.1